MKELTFEYFDQLVVQYRELHGPIKGLYSDPRGLLVEPHTGREVPIGTLQVAAYEAPAWCYDKILYVEKKGLRPIFEAVRLAERYDLAVVYGEGYPTEAARALFERADRDRRYRLFVLHDADPGGYDICRVLGEETRRMPGYSVDIVDLGLRVDQAVAMALQSEEFTRKKALTTAVAATLSALEREHFEGRPSRWSAVGAPREFVCRRFELNAMTAPELIVYVERRLADVGADGKVIPPADALLWHARQVYADQMRDRVTREIAALLDVDAIAAELADEFRDGALAGASSWPAEALSAARALAWRTAVGDRIAINVGGLPDFAARLRERVRAVIKEAS